VPCALDNKKRLIKRPRNRKVIALSMDAAFFFERAVESLDRYRYDKALKYFRRAAEYDPDNPVNYFNIAGILSEMGNFEESNQVLRQILDRFSRELTECYFYMANNYANMELFEQAEQALARYLEEDPDGIYLEESEEMLEFLSMELNRPVQIRNIKSREEFFQHDRARGLLEDGKFAEAVRLLEKIVRKHPGFTAARNNLALAYYYTGQIDRCLQTIDDVLRQEPGNIHAMCNLAIVYKHTGQLEPLRRVKDRLARTVPFQPDHLFKLATTMGILEEHELAYRHFRRLIRKEGHADPFLYHYAAAAACNTGRIAIALKYWREAEKLDPDSPVPKFYIRYVEPWALTESSDSGSAPLVSMKDTASKEPANKKPASQPQSASEDSVPGAHYHYALPFEESLRRMNARDGKPEDEWRRDPLLRASLLWALRHGGGHEKLTAIKAIGKDHDPELEAELRRLLTLAAEDDYLKRVAVLGLRRMGVKDALEAVLDGKKVRIEADAVTASLPVWLDVWQQVMDAALCRMGERYDMIQQHDLQILWVEYLSRTYPAIPRMVKPEAWAAALEYLTAKMHRRAISFRDVSDRYSVSVSTVRKNVERIDERCGVREKMKAVFPHFQGKL